MMNRISKRLLSLMMILCMVLTMLPLGTIPAYGADLTSITVDGTEYVFGGGGVLLFRHYQLG